MVQDAKWYLEKCASFADWMQEWDAPLRGRRVRRASKQKGSRNHTVRAKRRGLPRSYSVAMSIDRVGDRDGWVCQLCMCPIDDHMARSGPYSPCVDHIVPLNHNANTRHGHTPDNVQIAHRRCNEKKGCSVACPSLFECDNPRKHVRDAAIDQTPRGGKAWKHENFAQSPKALVREFLTGFPENGANHGPPRTIA